MRKIKFRSWNGQSMYSPSIEGSYDISEYLNECENLMQYTGIKDRNGVEIYEGDIISANIISWTILTMGEIVFDNKHSCYCNKNKAGLTQLQKLNNLEVIGNIYENPELLKDS